LVLNIDAALSFWLKRQQDHILGLGVTWYHKVARLPLSEKIVWPEEILKLGRVPQGRSCIHSAEVVSLSSILEENSSEKAYDVGGGGGDREDNDEDDIPNWVGPWDVTSDHIQIDDFTADRLLENDGRLDETLDLRELWNFDLLNI